MAAFETPCSEPPSSCCVLDTGGAGRLSGDLVDWLVWGICSNGRSRMPPVLFIAHPLAHRHRVARTTSASASQYRRWRVRDPRNPRIDYSIKWKFLGNLFFILYFKCIHSTRGSWSVASCIRISVKRDSAFSEHKLSCENNNAGLSWLSGYLINLLLLRDVNCQLMKTALVAAPY